MILICKSYAQYYHITFNPAKTKLRCFNVSSSDISLIYLNGTPVTVIKKDKQIFTKFDFVPNYQCIKANNFKEVATYFRA